MVPEISVYAGIINNTSKKQKEVLIIETNLIARLHVNTKANSGPWGNACRSVMLSLKGKRFPPITCKLLPKIMNTLFPEDVSYKNLPVHVDLDEIPVAANEMLKRDSLNTGPKRRMDFQQRFYLG